MIKEFESVFLNNTWVAPGKLLEIFSPYDGTLVGKVGIADAALMKQAVDAASEAFKEMKCLPVYKVADGLSKMKQYFIDHLEEVAKDLSAESGKPITFARIEVQRAIHTFEDGVEECKRIYGQTIPLDRRPWGENRTGVVERFPLGVIAAISSFNFPLNLSAHKVVPALASKNTVVLRPATQTPFSSLHIAKAYELSGLPKGGLNVLPSDYAAADVLVTDETVKMVSFTGSGMVGWSIKEKTPKKKVVLELGGNAAVIVHEDCINLETIVSAIASGGFNNAGNSCISVQRVFIHKSLYSQVLDLLIKTVQAMIVGDPRDEKTQIASLINTKEADRIMVWIEEAKQAGALVVTGGSRKGNVITPTILTNTTSAMKVNSMEVFGPLITVSSYDNFDSVLREVNNSEFGLQVGIFTQNINLVHSAYKELEVGGVIINDVPTWRIDHMPYGGVKMSGIGREGVRYAMEEMTEPKLLVVVYPARR